MILDNYEKDKWTSKVTNAKVLPKVKLHLLDIMIEKREENWNQPILGNDCHIVMEEKGETR